MNLFDRFEQNARIHPHKPAFIYFDKRNWITLTYKDILDQTHRLLRGLEAGPWTPGMTAALISPPSADFFPFALALLKFGIIPILLEPAIGIKRIGEIFKESKPDIFIGNGLTHALRMIFGWGKDSIKYNLTIQSVKGAALSLPKGQKSNVSPSSIVHRPSSVTAIIYTSGSTGLPKGAVYTQTNLAAQLDLLKNTFQITPDEIDLPAFPLYALIDLLLGVTSVIPDITFPVPGKTDPAKVIFAIQRFNVTNMFASPVVLEILSSFALPKEHGDDVSGGVFVTPQSKRIPALRLRTSQRARSSPLRAELPSLKRIITAGAPATIALQQRFRHLLADRTDLFGIYGATETLPIA
ncbi:MAG: AMP-binding protein, partial [Chloroflexi bacterium]|nr:AMP-binding protein [Chloroflexota bacterium]